MAWLAFYMCHRLQYAKREASQVYAEATWYVIDYCWVYVVVRIHLWINTFHDYGASSTLAKPKLKERAMWDHKIEQYAISTALGLRMSYLSRHDKPYRQSSLTWYVTWYSMNIYTIPTSKPNALTLSPNKIVQHFLSTRLCISLTHNLSIQRLQWTCKSYVHRTGHVHNQLWVW